VNVLRKTSFERAFKKLRADRQEEIRDAARRLPEAFKSPHVHSGLGIRRMGNYFEFRVGLDLRVLFLVVDGDIILETVGNHDEIRRFIKEKS
jgi:mRNA-degrading endonuclease RelE of RelBE toxin-antitoxin system